MMLINRLFKGLAVVLTVMGGIVIIWLVANFVQLQLRISSSPLQGGLARGFILASQARQTELTLILLFIASAVEIALFWLLVVLNVVSRQRGFIATLVLFIFVGIFVFIVYSKDLQVSS